MNIRAMLTAKTAAEVIGRTKIAVEDEWAKASAEDAAFDEKANSLTERFKRTDPRMWSTPAGMVAGLALTHALSDPGKRSRSRYALGATAGAAGGYGAGMALKEHASFYDTDDVEEAVARLRGGDPEGFSIPEGSTHTDVDKIMGDYLYANPELLSDSQYNPVVDRMSKFMKNYRVPGGETAWKKHIHDPGKIHSVGKWADKAMYKLTSPLRRLVGAGKFDYGKEYERAVMRRTLADMADRAWSSRDSYKNMVPHIQKARARAQRFADTKINPLD